MSAVSFASDHSTATIRLVIHASGVWAQAAVIPAFVTSWFLGVPYEANESALRWVPDSELVPSSKPIIGFSWNSVYVCLQKVLHELESRENWLSDGHTEGRLRGEN